MLRAVWLTDIHLEFLNREQIQAFVQQVAAEQPNVVLLTGDIGTARNARNLLIFMAQQLKVPICFVLGNHDYYHGDLDIVRDTMRKLTQESLGPVWMPEIGIVQLTNEVGLVGHGAWADGRYGDYHTSDIMLNDYVLIGHLSRISPSERLKRLNQLGDEAAVYLRNLLQKAVQQYRQIYVLTHAPPFLDVYRHKGRLTKPDNPYLPHFACKVVGDMLLDVAEQHPDNEFTVLCGHTHGEAYARITDNLVAYCGGAEYNHPVVQRVFEF